MTDISEQLRAAVECAFNDSQPLHVSGSGSKAFLGESLDTQASPLDITAHRGIINYQPGELTVTVRAGTPLTELQDTLAEQGQMLAFEPPAFGTDATIGGTVAAGLSGPARAYAGAARDFVLGCRIINGRGQILRFGGEVMKNVAGYDLSRLMAGSFGTLGVVLDVSLKVLPKPRTQTTLRHACDAGTAITQFNRWAGKPLPITATWWQDGHSYTRLAGAQPAVAHARKMLGGDVADNDMALWAAIREQRHAFFVGDAPLWRLSVAPATPLMTSANGQDSTLAIEWGGAQRWLRTSQDTDTVRQMVASTGGHADNWRGDASPRFQPLPPRLLALHQRLKNALDPLGLFNPDRLYPGL